MKVLSAINIYPIKSLGGIQLESTKIEGRGLEYDRRYVVTDENGKFLTQRAFPIMSTIRTTKSSSGFTLTEPCQSIAPLELNFAVESGATGKVQIWKDEVEAIHAGEEAAFWLSQILGSSVQLWYMPDTSQRQVDRGFAAEGTHVSFADGYPILIAGQASLDDLNARLEHPVPMNRFRPNLVFTGGQAYEEDTWNAFTIGKAKLKAVKTCSRCIMTTVDQESGIKGTEPLSTLSSYRKENNRVLFGMNVLAMGTGEIQVGDEITL